MVKCNSVRMKTSRLVNRSFFVSMFCDQRLPVHQLLLKLRLLEAKLQGKVPDARDAPDILSPEHDGKVDALGGMSLVKT